MCVLLAPGVHACFSEALLQQHARAIAELPHPSHTISVRSLSRQFMALGGRDLSNTPDTVKTAFQASQKCHTVYKRPNQACCMLRAKVHIDCIFSSMLASWDCIVESTHMCSRLRLAPPSTPIETRGLVDSPDLDRACFFIVCN